MVTYSMPFPTVPNQQRLRFFRLEPDDDNLIFLAEQHIESITASAETGVKIRTISGFEHTMSCCDLAGAVLEQYCVVSISDNLPLSQPSVSV
jgi:hypothetical protein